MKSLNGLFTISSGLVFKRFEAPPNTSGYQYKLITLKSINELGYIHTEYLDDFVSKKEISSKYIAKVGDVVIRLSNPYTAAMIDKKLEGTVITSLFAILRPKTNQLLSEYTSIYLNSDYMKKHYHRDASGSALQMIKTSALKDYRIIVPTLEKQQLIVEINRLSMRELDLLERLLENKKMYKRTVMKKLMEEE